MTLRTPLAAALAMVALAAAPAAHAAAAGCTPQVSLVEQAQPQPGGTLLGQYVMTTGNLCGLQIVALAVDNNHSLAAYSNLPGWNALVVTNDFWDAGMVLSRDDFGSGSSYQVTTGPAGIGSFASFFGPAAELANVYWLSAHYGGPVVDDSTAFTAVGGLMPLPEDAFQFEARAIASVPVVLGFDPSNGLTAVVAQVPEPAPWGLALVGALVGALMLQRRLRRC